MTFDIDVTEQREENAFELMLKAPCYLPWLAMCDMDIRLVVSCKYGIFEIGVHLLAS